MGVETALMAVSMGAQLAGTGMSIAQAAKQNQLAKQAAADAEKAMAEAKKELEKNYYASLGIAKEPYALQRQALLSEGAQAIAAGAESQRGAASTAGRVLMAQNAAQQGVTSAMAKDLYNLNALTAGEDARLAGKRSDLDLAQVKGAQAARHAAIVARNQAIASAIGGVSGAAKTGLDAYSKFYVNDKTTPDVTSVTTPDAIAKTTPSTNIQPIATSVNPEMMSTPDQAPFGYGQAWGPANYSVGPWQYQTPQSMPSLQNVLASQQYNPEMQQQMALPYYTQMQQYPLGYQYPFGY